MQKLDYRFLLLWGFIISVSVHDGYLLVRNRHTMWYEEQNPIGRWLIEMNGSDIWLLLAAKTLGTTLALALLLVLYGARPQLAWIACVSTALFQLALVLFLHYA